MITVGIDLAASPKKTGVAVLDGLRVVELKVDADDDCLVALCGGADKIGIDCPLGWPDKFIEFVLAHRRGDVAGSRGTVGERQELAYRSTDIYCRKQFGLRPLSVSADRIGHAAMRCAAVLPLLDKSTDRDGDGRIVETYPAGSLAGWCIDSTGYKGAVNRATRDGIVERLAAVVKLGSFADRCRDSDHALDAVVAALTAYAAARGAVHPIPAEFAEVARREGWIRLPDCRLKTLAQI